MTADTPERTAELPRVLSADGLLPGQLDQDALRVISRLERYGHEAYLVGGCVRDLLIGRRPKDFDVATSAHPRQIKRLFRNGRIIGRRFRLVHIHYGDHIVETATFRRDPFGRETESVRDAELANGPPPEGEGGLELARERERSDPEPDESDAEDLLITEDNEYGTAEEDARRRDFTVNALFLDATRGRILDYVGGLDDLDSRLLRTIGDPMIRIAEDPVRILRAVKFATRLSFRIEPATWESMCAQAPLLQRSAPPRVLEEILRLMRSGTSLGALRMLRACGALGVVLPPVDAYVGDESDPAAAQRAERLWHLLEALDADVHGGFVPTTPVCIAILFLGIIERESEPATRTLPGPPRDLASVAAEVLEPLTAAARLSRRDCSRARRIVAQQRRFTQPATRRFRPLLFMRSEDFSEALDLFRLRSAALGEGWDIYEGWRERYDLALRAPPEEIESERRSSRRRRRRRRGRRSGATGDAAS